MSARMTYQTAAPDVLRAMLGLSGHVKKTDLDPNLLDLMYFRASQINGCAFCLEMHGRDLRARGEQEYRLDVLAAWREAPFYTDRERAALAWTEAVTRLTDGQVSDEVYAEARVQFDERELAELTLAVVAINGWNRLNVAFRTEPATPTDEQLAEVNEAVALAG